MKNNDHKTVTSRIGMLIVALGLLPLLTSPLLKEEHEDVQNALKSTSWLAATLVCAIGYKRETDPRLVAERSLSDGRVNGDYNMQRTQNIHYYEKQQARQHALHETRMAAFYANAGILQVDKMPDTMKPFVTMDGVPLYGAPQQQMQSASPHNPIELKPGALAIDPAFLNAGTDTVPQSTIDAAYDAIFDPKVRNGMHTLIYGSSGDTKTCMLHYAIYRLLQRQPHAVILVCDRKHGSSGSGSDEAEAWRSNWFGAPVYPELKDLTKSSVPISSVYTDFKPEFHTWLEWIWDYIIKYRYGSRKDEDGEYIERTVEEKKRDPLWSEEFQELRPIYLLCDDATGIIKEMERNSQARAIEILNQITTLGRSENVSLIYIAHANTQTDLLLSAPALDAMEVVQGASMCGGSEMRSSFNRRKVDEEGVRLAEKTREHKARGFASSIPGAGYIPPARLSDGLRGLIIPSIALQWMINSPSPKSVLKYHRAMLASQGFKYEKGKIIPLPASERTVASKVEPVVRSVDQDAVKHIQPRDERQILINLRQWASDNAETDDESLVKACCSEGLTLDEATRNIAGIKTVLAMTEQEFANLR